MQETKPSRTRARPAKECQHLYEQAVYVSELENWQCEVPGLSNIDKIVSGLSEVDRASRFVNLCFLAFRSSEKDDPCNEPSLLLIRAFSYFQALCDVIFEDIVSPIFKPHRTEIE